MDKYMVVLQICAILFICFLLYFLYKFILSLMKKNRLSYFSLDLGKEKYSEVNIVMKWFYKFSDFLKSLVIFNCVARTYDKYVRDDGKLRNGIDFISFKIIVGLLLTFVYVLVASLYRDNISTLLLIITFILGFVLIDFYCIFYTRKRVKLMSNSVITSIIVMNNSFKVNRSIEQAIEDTINRSDDEIKKEFSKVLSDIRLGLGIDVAFRRMYKRTNLNIILYISNVFSLVNKCNISLVEVFNSLEDKLLSDNKFNKELRYLDRNNNLARIIFAIIPLVFIVTVIVYNPKYFDLMISSSGYIIILVLSIVYIFYLLVINKLVRGSRYGR